MKPRSSHITNYQENPFVVQDGGVYKVRDTPTGPVMAYAHSADTIRKLFPKAYKLTSDGTRVPF
jgi:hypothetical protein